MQSTEADQVELKQTTIISLLESVPNPRAFRRSEQHHMVVRSKWSRLQSSHCWNQSQILEHSACQNSTTWWSDRNEADCNHLIAGISPKSSSIPPVITAPHGGQIESLWDCNYGRRGLHLSAQCFIMLGFRWDWLRLLLIHWCWVISNDSIARMLYLNK